MARKKKLMLERNTLNLKTKQANNKLFKRPFNTELQKLSLSNDAKYKTFLSFLEDACYLHKNKNLVHTITSHCHTEGLFKWKGGR